MSQRALVATVAFVIGTVVFILDGTAGRIVLAGTEPSDTTLLAAVVSLGGVVFAAGVAGAIAWAISSAMLPDEAFKAPGQYAAVTAELRARERHVIAEAERIAKQSPPADTDSPGGEQP